MRKALLSLSSNNPIIHSVYYYDFGKNCIMSTIYGDTAVDRFPDLEWMPLTRETNIEYPYFMDTRTLVNDYRKSKPSYDVISVLYRSPNNLRNYYVLNLDVNYLYEQFVAGHAGLNDEQFFLLSGLGKMLISEGTSNEREVVVKMLTESESSNIQDILTHEVFDFSGKDVFLVKLKS